MDSRQSLKNGTGFMSQDRVAGSSDTPRNRDNIGRGKASRTQGSHMLVESAEEAAPRKGLAALLISQESFCFDKEGNPSWFG